MPDETQPSTDNVQVQNEDDVQVRDEETQTSTSDDPDPYHEEIAWHVDAFDEDPWQ